MHLAMGKIVLAVTVGAVATIAGLAGSAALFIANASAGGSQAVPITIGIGQGGAAGVLGYLVWKFVRGEIVAVSTATREATLADLTKTSQEHVELLYDAFKRAGYPAAAPKRRATR